MTQHHKQQLFWNWNHHKREHPFARLVRNNILHFMIRSATVFPYKNAHTICQPVIPSIAHRELSIVKKESLLKHRSKTSKQIQGWDLRPLSVTSRTKNFLNCKKVAGWMYRLPQCSQELSLNQFKLAVLTHETSQYVAAVDTSYSPKAPFLDELGMREKKSTILTNGTFKKNTTCWKTSHHQKQAPIMVVMVSFIQTAVKNNFAFWANK